MKNHAAENVTPGPVLSIAQRLKAMYSNSGHHRTTVDHVDMQNASSCIQYLPVNIKLHIFSYLDARSLCMACCVSREWCTLTSDDLLWQELMEKDKKSWSQISHSTDPQMYLDVNSEWSKKEIYLKCSPEFHKQFRQANSTFYQVSSALRYFLPKKVPKVAMFGPGLEQSTSSLVRNMFYKEHSEYVRTGLFPGQDGVGSGITLKLKNSWHSLHLAVLYTASRQERENRVNEERLQRNRMLQRQNHGNNDGEDEYQLNPQTRHFCQTVDGFIFVLDASQSEESIRCSQEELMIMTNERKATTHLPILVLSCVKDSNSVRIPAHKISELLQLSQLPFPWLIIDCESESLGCVDRGIVWLVDQAQYK